MVGGDSEVFEAMRPIFEVLGATITRVGGNGAGQATKACNQVLGSITLLGVCEALTLAKASGLDLEAFVQVAAGGAAQSWMIENLGVARAEGNLKPGFMVDLMQKDLGIVLSSAATLDVPTLGTALANQLYRSVQADGHGSDGIQAMILAYEALASQRVRPE